MKKILSILFLVGGLATLSCAVAMDVWRSSNTNTADQLQNLCPATTSYLVGTSTVSIGQHGVFHGVSVGVGVAASSVTFYNSAGTGTNLITVVATSTPTVVSQYDVSISSGLTYTNSSTDNITILYQCY